jgi:hypothetical protein
MAIDLRSLRELDVIRGKLSAGKATKKERADFLKYVDVLENLVGEASGMDFYGTEGWEHYIGIEE